MADQSNSEVARQPEPILRAIDAFSELHVRSGGVLRAWETWQGSVANCPAGDRPDPEEVPWGLAEGITDHSELEMRKAERRAKTPRKWKTWACHYDAYDDLVFAVCRWRESLDAVRELLPSIERWVDDKREPPAKRWTAQVRRLLGKFGGHFNRYTIGEVPDTLDTVDFDECATKIYKRLRYVMSVPPEPVNPPTTPNHQPLASESSSEWRKSLSASLENFYKTLDAATVPAADGGRKVGGVAHAVALSEATNSLHRELALAQLRLFQEHGSAVRALPHGLSLVEADSPDGPWTPVPTSDIHIASMEIGGGGADAVPAAALESAIKATAFPVEKWNAMQAVRPGGNHQRFHAGEVLSASMLADLESAVKLLRLVVQVLSEREQDESVHGHGNPPHAQADAIDEKDIAILKFLNERPSLRRKVTDVVPGDGPQDRKAIGKRLRRLADRTPPLVDYPKGTRLGVAILPAGVEVLKQAADAQKPQ